MKRVLAAIALAGVVGIVNAAPITYAATGHVTSSLVNDPNNWPFAPFDVGVTFNIAWTFDDQMAGTLTATVCDAVQTRCVYDMAYFGIALVTVTIGNQLFSMVPDSAVQRVDKHFNIAGCQSYYSISATNNALVANIAVTASEQANCNGEIGNFNGLLPSGNQLPLLGTAVDSADMGFVIGADAFNRISGKFDAISVVPIPATVWLLGTALAGLCGRRVMRRKLASNFC